MALVIRREVGRQLGVDLQPGFFTFCCHYGAFVAWANRRQKWAEWFALAGGLSNYQARAPWDFWALCEMDEATPSSTWSILQKFGVDYTRKEFLKFQKWRLFLLMFGKLDGYLRERERQFRALPLCIYVIFPPSHHITWIIIALFLNLILDRAPPLSFFFLNKMSQCYQLCVLLG